MPLDSIATVVAAAAVFASGAVVSTRQAEPTPSLLRAGAGWVDVDRRREEAVELGLGYRFGDGPWALRPFLAATVTSKGALYGWAGISYDLHLGPVTLSPSFGPGLYRAGDGIDLGYPLEFRSELEVGCRLGRRSRIGVSLAHMSNAGLGDINPGTETLTLYYTFAPGAR
jgi:lipid A 3-O-deacylase